MVLGTVRVPLVTFNPFQSRPSPSSRRSVYDSGSDDDLPSERRRWYQYVPLLVTVLLILLPHPSLLIVLVRYHLLARHATLQFGIHLFVTYALTILALSSLTVCAVRDPGRVPSIIKPDEDGEMELTEALMGPPEDDFLQPGRWCRACWAPKPERTHHCSTCGRCVLKMDHHCPWIGAKCVGHRTYAPFIHFLACITLYAVYIAVISIVALADMFSIPLALYDTLLVHMLFLACIGVAFGLVIGSFFGYHVYLVLTNQTTFENITPFHLLKHLPPFPPGTKLSSPPSEHELSYAQRRLVRGAHHAGIRLYDLGWRRNLAQVFGAAPRWRALLLYGGHHAGDGTAFPHNPRADEALAQLGERILKLEVEAEHGADYESRASTPEI